MTLLLVAMTPFLGAVVSALAIRWGRNACATVTAAVALFALALLLTEAPAVYRGEIVRWEVEWLPQLGLSLSFFVDGLGLFFAALILGIGFLIIVYARFYLRDSDPMGMFFLYLLLFQGAMLGIVISDNILLLLVFWELTSLTSFLLIGYWRHLPEARQGARIALVVTGAGGLALIAGMLMLGNIAGSYELSEILQRGEAIKASPLYLPTLLLILAGAFTKSAQFPFHFWLPHAMAAPTPVSAYLHSATMVKAGVFLLARLWPVLAGTDTWFLIVAPAGLVTMLIGAWIAIFKDDIKALLAYSTVSQLGLMTMLLGFGTRMAAVAAVFHVLNHATFKAPLFLCAGIVDHETETRDIRRLGGLLTLMPVTATLALIAAASSAGVPFLNGFLSKEMMLEETVHTAYLGNAWVFPALATLAAVFSVAYSVRFAAAVFLGPRRHDYPRHPHDPPAGMWLPVVVLAAPVVLIGIWPPLAEPVVYRTALAVVGGSLPEPRFAVWHGVTPALYLSAVAFAGGLLLFVAFYPVNLLRTAVPRPEAKRIFEGLVESSARAAGAISDRLHNGSLQRYVGVIAASTAVVGTVAFFGGEFAAGDRPMLPVSHVAAVCWLVFAASCVGVVVFHRDRLLTLILTGIVGLMVALAFFQFSAPDLALTQISVEIVSTILLLLVLNLLPKETPRETPAFARLRDGAFAAFAGLGVTGLTYAVLTRGFDTISSYHVAESQPGGGGTNVVNVILVDFRGYDTFGEIIVLGIAAITIFAILDSAMKGDAARRLDAMQPGLQSHDAHPMILVVATRVLLPLALTVGVYIFLRGHNLPGGGFIAGLIFAIALILQYMASGHDWAASRRQFEAQAMIGAGVGIAGLTGVASWVFARPFLTSTYGHLHLPLVGDVELASAVLFDLGVTLTVLGSVMVTLANISQIEQRAERMPQPGGPEAAPGEVNLVTVRER